MVVIVGVVAAAAVVVVEVVRRDYWVHDGRPEIKESKKDKRVYFLCFISAKM